MQTQKDQPWLFRTYAGHSTAAASNALYRGNLAKGQTGLSVAFDLPTQTGYDSDHVLSRGEVGKVGVPVSHLGDMRALFDQMPSVAGFFHKPFDPGSLREAIAKALKAPK